MKTDSIAVSDALLLNLAGKIAMALCVAVFFSFGSVYLYHELVSRLCWEKGKANIQSNRFGVGDSLLLEGMKHSPDFLPLVIAHGNACLSLSLFERNHDRALKHAARARETFENASHECPLNVEAYLGLGAALMRLEELDPKDGTTCQGLEEIQKAAALQPNGVNVHLNKLRLLAKCGQVEDLKQAVANISAIYPPSVQQLRRSFFWSQEFMAPTKEGLKQAISEGITIRESHQILSWLLEEEGDVAGAIDHYRRSLGVRQYENSSWNLIHLGRLLLKNSQTQAAYEQFSQALAISSLPGKSMEQIFHVFKSEKHFREFGAFYLEACRRFAMPEDTQILLGRNLLEQGEMDHAQKVFTDLAERAQSAAAWYWLARVAQKRKDWNSMELSIQKATVRDPKNSTYHLLFSQALASQGKLERAEKQASLAIANTQSPSPWLFNHRATLRMKSKDYKGAIADWHAALSLEPKRAGFHEQAGLAWQKAGNKKLALHHFQGALALDPDNPRYINLVQKQSNEM